MAVFFILNFFSYEKLKCCTNLAKTMAVILANKSIAQENTVKENIHNDKGAQISIVDNSR